MDNVEAIGIFDSRTIEFNNSILNYCNIYNIKISYTEYNNDIKYLNYLEILMLKLYEKLLNSNSEYIIIFGPYLKINFQNINPNLFFSKNFDLLFFESFSLQESWSFFIVKKSNDLLASIKKILAIEYKNIAFEKCAKDHNDSIKDYQLKIKNALLSSNLNLIDNFNKSVLSTFCRKKDIFNSFCTSFLDDSLNFDSKIASRFEQNSNLKIPDSKHYFNDICVVSLYTEGNENYAKYSLNSISEYCNKHYISYKFFNDILVKNAAPNWSKPFAISLILSYYDTVVWVDSDCLITNNDFNLRDFCRVIPKDFIAFNDPSSFFDFNSGVMIFKKSNFVSRLLNEVKTEILCTQDLTTIYSSGGDQNIFNKKIREIDKDKKDSMILPSNLMNSHPKIWKEGDFVLHAMGYGSEYREKYLAYLYQKKNKFEF